MKTTLNEVVIVTMIMSTVLCPVSLENKKPVTPDVMPFVAIDKKNQQLTKTLQNIKKYDTKPRVARLIKSSSTENSPGFFAALGSLFGGTIKDTYTAARNVSKLVRIAIAPQDRANTTTINIGTVLRNNYRGLRRLFDNQLGIAIQDSKRNLQTFKKELKDTSRLQVNIGTNTNNDIR